MLKRTVISPFSLFTVLCILVSFMGVEASNASAVGHLVPKHERKTLIATEYGEISAVNVSGGSRGPYQLQFITLEPNSIFLPVLLHADMVFYVHTGSGTLSWGDDDGIKNVNIRKGDIYRLHTGSIFYVQSSLEPEGEKLRINEIFFHTEDSINGPLMGAYSSINDLVHGFDSKVLQAAFNVPGDVIEEILKASKPPAIIHAMPKMMKISTEWQARLLKAFIGSNVDGFDSINGKKKKTKAYNVLEADPDFKNCNGWSLTVDKHDFRLLRDSNIGVFMVNLTKGSMMGPHWNPRASEIAIVLKGQGMIRVACSGNANESECKSLRFKVKEGDVFTVPRFHPMAQMSFNNDSFVFMGFTTSTKRNYQQYLAGKSSVLGILDRQILALSFNVTNTTIDQLLTQQQNESVILDCTSCAEEEERIMEEEIERERKEEEERRREEEETKKKEEEEDRKRKEGEEKEATKREAEEKERREEEVRRQEEERQRRARQEEEERKRRKEKEKQEENEQENPKREEEEKGQQDGRRKQEEAAAMEQEEAQIQEKERQPESRDIQEGGNGGKTRIPNKIRKI